MSVATVMGVKQAAKRATNHRRGGTGVLPRYVQAEITRGKLKARLVTPDVGTPYYIITEEDFIAWEDNRRPKQE